MRVVTLESWRKVRTMSADGVWDDSKIRSVDWTVGEAVVVLVALEGVVTADVSGARFKPDPKAWDDDAHNWRVPLAGFKVLEGMTGQRLNASIRAVLRRSYGEQVYFRILRHGIKLGDEPEARIRELLQSAVSAEPFGTA
ncbi:MAG: hypothetical protein ACPL2N_05350 [Candidatus Cryosericum sp.]